MVRGGAHAEPHRPTNQRRSVPENTGALFAVSFSKHSNPRSLFNSKMMKVKMMNIVNTPPLDHFDEHSESSSPGGSEISIWVYYGTRKNVLQINGGGIIYIKQRTHTKT